MNIENRKIQLVQEIINLNDEDIIINIEEYIQKQLNEGQNNKLSHELNKQIDNSEKDFEKGLFKTAEELLDEYQ